MRRMRHRDIVTGGTGSERHEPAAKLGAAVPWPDVRAYDAVAALSRRMRSIIRKPPAMQKGRCARHAISLMRVLAIKKRGLS